MTEDAAVYQWVIDVVGPWLLFGAVVGLALRALVDARRRASTPERTP